MKKMLVAAAMAVSAAAFAQQPPRNPQPQTPAPAPAGVANGAPNLSNFANMLGGQRTASPRPFKEVITDKAETQKGLFTVHKLDDKYFFEIADSLLGREILAVTRFAKVPTGAGYGGELANQQTITFEKGPSNNIFMRVVTLVNVAEEDQQIFKAVSNSNVNAIAAAFPIAAFGKDSTSSVIDVSEFFKGDNQAVSINARAKRNYSLNALAQDRSYISKISTYPINN